MAGHIIKHPQRYHEFDGQGVIYNAWYPAWFDEALTRFFEHAGITPDDMASEGFDYQLVHSEIDWRSGVRRGDDVEIHVQPGKIGTTSFQVHYSVRRNGTESCAARVVYVSVARDGSGKTPVPGRFRRALESAMGDTAGRVTPADPHR
ncbi:hypothetical protein AMIS_27060 [Actinoplanes missouriensis 431]|uniref:Thioesterase domain-containing protein n=1 Tax=Actinoplanes missouriensis (strain ATCC 14538 / DSM 43046 / CBS 188.64 / JCM 3121 / NBRC 102363 / NCIMB 12654 / NRRL B-3342 / UNCC 431) TaxID=512565 RepID=I0H4I9_ACTM4|nr:thioesterase family protein [Actinoplanes missouriensis]BAL87926.1 hypothetical protein AMIS_27060 [Actinoplanes missouriensis 431]